MNFKFVVLAKEERQLSSEERTMVSRTDACRMRNRLL